MQIKHSSIIEEKLQALDDEEEGKLHEIESYTDEVLQGELASLESEPSLLHVDSQASKNAQTRRSKSIFTKPTDSQRLLKVEEIASSESSSISKKSKIEEESDEDSDIKLDNIKVKSIEKTKRQ